MILRDEKVDMLSRSRTRKESTPIQNLIKRIKRSVKKSRLRVRLYGSLCKIFLATTIVLLYGSSLWASQSDPNDDSWECQFLLNNFDSNQPLISTLFPGAWWDTYTDKNNIGTKSDHDVDCNDGADNTSCLLKWTYETKGEGSYAYVRLRLSGRDWKTPVDLSMFDKMSFYIKGKDDSVRPIKVQFWTTRSDNERKLSSKAVTRNTSSQWDKKFVQLRGNSELSGLDLRRIHSIEFVDGNEVIVTNTIWIDQICLHSEAEPNALQPLITLENEKVSFKLTQSHGSLHSIIDKDTGIELLSAGPPELRHLYRIAYTLDDSTPTWTTNCQAEQFSYDLDVNESGSRLSGRWIHKWDTSEAEVLVTAELPASSRLATWRISVNTTEDTSLDNLVFPSLVGVDKLGAHAEDDILLVPHSCGRIYMNPSEQLSHWRTENSACIYPSTFTSMQFVAYYDDDIGFFVSSLDPNGLSKLLSWDRRWNEWTTIKIVNQYLTAAGHGNSFQTAVRLGVFQGDWPIAATIYRSWAQEQWWAKDISSKGTPNWLTRIGIAKVYEVHRGRSEQMDYHDWGQKIAEHIDYFAVPTIARLVGWEHGGTWAFGDYFPPQDGWEAFGLAVQDVRSLNTYPVLNVGTNRVMEDSPAWHSSLGQDASVRSTDGEPLLGDEPLVDRTERIAYMCLESDAWLCYLREVFTELAQSGVPEIQLDGFPVVLPPCYSETHQHGKCAGSGARPYKLFDNIRLLRDELRISYPNLVFSGEGGAELFLPILDSWHHRNCCAEAVDPEVNNGLSSVVPLYQFVYHENLIFVNAYSFGPWPDASPADSNYDKLAVGRAFVWGGVCCYNMQDWLENYVSLPSFCLLKKCAQARVGFLRDFLVFGRMLPPPEVDGPLMRIEIKERWNSDPNDPLLFSSQVPSILTSAWQSEKGDVAVIVLNIGEDALSTRVPLSQYSSYVYPGMSMYIYDDNDLVATRIVEGDLGQEQIDLEPLHFVAFVLGE